MHVSVVGVAGVFTSTSVVHTCVCCVYVSWYTRVSESVYCVYTVFVYVPHVGCIPSAHVCPSDYTGLPMLRVHVCVGLSCRTTNLDRVGAEVNDRSPVRRKTRRRRQRHSVLPRLLLQDWVSFGPDRGYLVSRQYLVWQVDHVRLWCHRSQTADD